MSAPTFPYSEKLVADQLGLSRKEAREIRECLNEGVDWSKNEAGAIILSEQGVGIMAKWVDKARPNLELCLAAQKKNGGPRHMIVVAVCMNPRMVLANESGEPNAERFLVDVGNNKNMRIGDPMEVGPHDAQADVLRCLSKLPRDDRRPQIQGSLRASDNWGQREMNAIVERARKAGK